MTVQDGRWQRTPIRNEASWIPRDLADLEHLRTTLADAGHAGPVINAITGWLVAKATGEPDTSGSSTRSGYRKILAELGPGPNPNGDRNLRDAGDIDRGTLVGSGLVGSAGMAMAVGQPLAALALVLVLAAHNARPPVMSERELVGAQALAEAA